MRLPSFRSLCMAGVIGATLAYFLDPNHGGRRRNTTRDTLGKGAGRVAGTATSTVQQVGGQVTGIVRERVPVRRRDNPHPDDKTLADRVESELFRDSRFDRSKLNVNVANGIVELRGQLDAQAEIDEVEHFVRGIADVRDVHNFLHLPGTPAPNKEDSLHAGE
jgi:osmotically-inducible protein OsmY